MIRWYGRPDRVALAMVAALEAGTVQTPGQWVDFIAHLQALPAKLQLWTLERIREITGETTYEYLLTQMIPPKPRRYGVRHG
ncbi:MAG: hypothetical protein WC294_02220 [Methanoregula sp.]|jgi:hypothetical protein